MPTLLVIGAAAAALAVAGCGGGGGGGSSSSAGSTGAAGGATGSTGSTGATGSTASGGGGATLDISADPGGQLAFDKKTLSASAGKVTITMANPSQLPHGVAIEGNGANTTGKVVQNGGTSTVSADLKPGTYTFYCPVPGHREAGMEGTLTVK